MARAAKKKANTQADRLAQGGIEAKRVYDVVLMDPADLHLETRPNMPNFDPRVNDPVDPEDPIYQSILAKGVEQPVQAREDGERNGKKILTVVVGRGRVKKLMHINKHHPLPTGPRRLKVILVKGTDAEMVLLNLSSNVGKPESPFSRAVKIGKAEKLGMSLEDIARACGWTSTLPVKQHMPILNFPPELQGAFHGPDALPLTSVAKFAKVPAEERLAALKTVRDGGAKKVREVTAAVEAAQNGAEYVPPPKVKKMWGRERMEKLAEAVETQAKELEAEQTKASATPTDVAESETCSLDGARALLKFLLGDADALKPHPRLRAAVAQVAAEI